MVQWDEVENCHEKNNWKVIFKTEFNRAELVWLFYLLQKIYHIKIKIRRPILSSSESASNLKSIISTHATLDQGLCQGLLLVFLQFD